MKRYGARLLKIRMMVPWSVAAAVLLASYLPLYFSGAPRTGRACRPWFGEHWIWSWIWRNLIGLPLAESRWRAEDFRNPSARYIFGSHPHGVMSLHHIGLMMTPAVSLPGKAFSVLSPISTRRDLAASILFRIPFFREMALCAGAVDADRKVASKMLETGYSIGVLVGGEQEQLLSQEGEHLVYVQRRKGHIKLAQYLLDKGANDAVTNGLGCTVYEGLGQ